MTRTEIGPCKEDIRSSEQCNPEGFLPVVSENPSEFQQEIPICVYFKGKMTVINMHPNSLSKVEMKEKIRRNFGVPTKLQLLLYKGKVLCLDSVNTLKPYDNINVLIRGRGGMLSSQIGKKYF